MFRLGLRSKSILFTVGMTVLLGVVLGGYGYVQLRRHLLEEQDRWIRSTALSLAESASYATFTEDLEVLDSLAERVLTQDDVVRVSINDVEGAELTERRDDRSAPEAADDRARSVVSVPILFGDGSVDGWAFDADGIAAGDDTDGTGTDGDVATAQRVGEVHLVVSRARVFATLSRALRTTTATTLLIMGIAALVAMVWMRRIVQPLTDMTEVADRMKAGDFARTFETRSAHDEVGTLVAAFGTMKESVREHTEQLYKEKMKDLSLANEAVMNFNAELLRVNRRKSAFLADMSHELRTPLNAMIGFSDLMNEGLVGELNDEQGECVRDILSSGKHLLTLINDILDIAKIESGKAELRLEPVVLRHVIDEVTTSVKGLAFQKGLELVVEVDDALSEPMLVDGRRIKQVLLNLLGNAVKYSQTGTVTLTASRVSEGVDALRGGQLEQLRITVKDEGIGIAPEDRARVFSEFDRVDNKYSREQEGTGLGLALAKKLVDLHDGTIDFVSEVGAGTEFLIMIPWQTADSLPAEQPPEQSADASVPLVLVVEDDQASASLLAMTLRQSGYQVEIAATGGEALLKSRELRPDAITLDIGLPDQDGWSVLEEIRASPDVAKTPVIIVSGDDGQARGVALGVSAYLVKPVDRTDFLAALRAVAGPSEPGLLLAIDDDPSMLRWYHRVLGGAGWTVETADTGRAGLDRLESVQPDVVVLDVMMAGMSGLDVLEVLREDPRWDDLPFLIVTGKDLTPEERARLDGHVRQVLQKGSFSGRELVHALFQASEKKAAPVSDD